MVTVGVIIFVIISLYALTCVIRVTEGSRRLRLRELQQEQDAKLDEFDARLTSEVSA